MRAPNLSGIIHVDGHTRVYTADSITRRLMASILACARREQMNYTIAPCEILRGRMRVMKFTIVQSTHFNINFESHTRLNHEELNILMSKITLFNLKIF